MLLFPSTPAICFGRTDHPQALNICIFCGWRLYVLSVFNKFIVYNLKFCTIATFVIVDIETTYYRQYLDSVAFIFLPAFMCLAKWLCSYRLRGGIQQYSSHRYHVVIFHSAILLPHNSFTPFQYLYYHT